MATIGTIEVNTLTENLLGVAEPRRSARIYARGAATPVGIASATYAHAGNRPAQVLDHDYPGRFGHLELTAVRPIVPGRRRWRPPTSFADAKLESWWRAVLAKTIYASS